MTLEENVQQIRDALVVTTAMVLRHEQRLQQHQEWLEAEERSIARHREWLDQHDFAMRSITEKLDRLEDLLLRGRGGNGQH